MTQAKPTFEKPPQRILIIKPSSIGDVVHALPVLGLVRRRWPQAQISWLAAPPCDALLDGHPNLHEVIRFERRRFGRGWWNPASLLDLIRFAHRLRQRKFDLVIDLQGLLRSSLSAWQTGAPVRIGFTNARELSWVLYTHRVHTTWEPHAVERYLMVAEALGCETQPVEFSFAVTNTARAAAAKLLEEMSPKGARYAVLLPGATWMTKRWPVESFAALVQPLKERLGLEVVVAGGRQDAELARQVPGHNVTGRTDLAQLVALLERADLVIANDSGPMHIAAALGRPLVALFGPTHAVRTGPFGRMDSVISLEIPCRPCYARSCVHQSCLRELGIEPVLKLASEQMRLRESPHILMVGHTMMKFLRQLRNWAYRGEDIPGVSKATTIFLIAYAIYIIGIFVAGALDVTSTQGGLVFVVSVVGGGVFMAGAYWQYSLKVRARRRFATNACQKCGYNLEGNVSGICPECGTRIGAIKPVL